MLQFCPIHQALFSGDPLRCQACEPDQAEADFIYNSRLTIQDIEDVTEKQAEAFFRHLEIVFAQNAAKNN